MIWPKVAYQSSERQSDIYTCKREGKKRQMFELQFNLIILNPRILKCSKFYLEVITVISRI